MSPGQYEKNASVWAEQATQSGNIQTKEGSTAYSAGDYLVFNDSERKDGYAMKESKFRDLYESVE